MGILSRTPPRRDSWALTQWSILSRLDRREEPTWQASWTYLVETYRAPMERYVQRVLSRTLGRAATQEEAAADAPEDIDEFNEGWVRIAVDRALATLAEEHERYQAVVVDLIATDGEGSPDLAERMGLSRAQFPVLKHRARKRFCRLFEEELAKTVGDQEAFDEEWRALQPYLR